MPADTEGDLLERLRSERTNPDLYERLGDLYAANPALVDKAVRNYLEAARLRMAGAGAERAPRAARAAEILARAAGLSADRDPILFRLAEAHEAAGDNAAAEQVYRDLLSRSAAEGRPFFHLALLERIAMLAPHDLEHRRLTAETRERLGMHASAARDLADVARIEAREGQAAQATADAERALALLPGAAELLEARAEVADLLGDREGAARAWLEAAQAWRKEGDEARARLAAEHAIAPSEAQPLGGDAEGGSALLVLSDPLLLAHAESLALGVGLTPLRVRSTEIATLPANLRIALVETATLGDGAAWDAVVGLRAATHLELPVAVVESDEHPLGDEDRRMLLADGIALVGSNTPFSAMARLLGEAAALSPLLGPASAAEPLLPFDDLPSSGEGGAARESVAPATSLAEFEARFPQVAAFIRALKLDGARRETELGRLAAELDSARSTLASERAAADERLRELVHTVEGLREASASLRRDAEEAVARLDAQRRMAERSREEAEALRAEAGRATSELRLAHEREGDLEQALTRLEAERQALAAAEAARLRTEEGLRTELAALTAEASSARRYAAERLDIERERDTQREDAAAARGAERRALEQVRQLEEEARAGTIRLEVERAARRAAEDETAAVADRLAGRERELDEARAAQRRLEDEHGRVADEQRAAAARAETERAARRSAEDEARGLRDALQQRERELAQSRSAAEAAEERRLEQEQASELRRKALAERWAGTLSALEAERTALDERVRALEASLNESRAAEARASAAATAAASEWTRARAGLELELDRLRSEGATLTTTLAERAQTLEHERDASARARADAERLGLELAQRERELGEIGVRHEALEGEARALRARVGETSETLGRTRAESETLGRERSALIDRVEALARELASERSERSHAHARAERLEADATGARGELERLRPGLAALAAQLEESESARRSQERDLERQAREAERLAAELEGAEKRVSSVLEDASALRARLLASEQQSAATRVDRDRLRAEAEAERSVVESLRAALVDKSGQAMRAEGELRTAREELERTTAERDRLRAEAEARARKSAFARLFGSVSPVSFALGLVVGLTAVTLLLAVLWLRAPGSETVASPLVATPAPPSAAPSLAPAEAATPALPSPAPSLAPISLTDYADIERRLVRRAERPGYRVTAKLRTADEVRASLAYQAGARGWTAAELAAAIDQALGATEFAFRFERATYLDVLVENLGLDQGLDVNSIAAAFALVRDGRVSQAAVGRREEPKVVTSSSEGSSRVQAVTLSLEFPEPTAFPAELQFRPLGAEPSALTFESAP